ncbi:MAG: hypothetical protein U0359_16810 [Byssovorax sp.]
MQPQPLQPGLPPGATMPSAPIGGFGIGAPGQPGAAPFIAAQPTVSAAMMQQRAAGKRTLLLIAAGALLLLFLVIVILLLMAGRGAA